MKYLVILFSLFFSSLTFTFAQNAGITGSILINPEYPKPFTTISARLQSYSFDIDRALITWSIDGKQVLSGVGETKVSVPIGGEGSLTRVSVAVRPSEGGVFNDQIIITPASVSLVWETTDTYVPAWYKGKPLPSEGGLIRVVALPSFYNGNTPYNPKNIDYQWSVNSERVKAFSGIGKQTLDMKLNYLENENTISVVATTFDGAQSAEESITVVPTPVTPKFYMFDPLFGVDYSKSFLNRVEIKKPTSFIFEPYYISGTDLTSPNIVTQWLLNGLPIETGADGILSVTPKPNSTGVGALSVTIEQTKKYLQKAEASLNIVFDTTNN